MIISEKKMIILFYCVAIIGVMHLILERYVFEMLDELLRVIEERRLQNVFSVDDIDTLTFEKLEKTVKHGDTVIFRPKYTEETLADIPDGVYLKGVIECVVYGDSLALFIKTTKEDIMVSRLRCSVRLNAGRDLSKKITEICMMEDKQTKSSHCLNACRIKSCDQCVETMFNAIVTYDGPLFCHNHQFML
jgi:hypothetical protein